MPRKFLKLNKETKEFEAVEEHSRDEFIGIVNTLYDRLEDRDKKIYTLEERLKRPTDEALTQAYEIIDRMKLDYETLYQLSFIKMTPKQYEILEGWKLRHWKENRKCQRMGLKYERFVEDGQLKIRCNLCGEVLILGEEENYRFSSTVRDAERLRIK